MLRLKRLFLAITLVTSVSYLTAQSDPSREQSRSMVMTQYGIVATSQAVASQAGAEMLARGGSAADAAIAANAVLGVIEPMMNGIGGDLFAIVYEAKTKKLYGLNSSGWTPKGMTIESSEGEGRCDEIGRRHPHHDGAGRVAGWDALRRRFGQARDRRGLAPAAATGGERLSRCRRPMRRTGNRDRVRWQARLRARLICRAGRRRRLGRCFRNPALAAIAAADRASRAATAITRGRWPRAC